jgi:CRP-like cAMP-binding protein
MNIARPTDYFMLPLFDRFMKKFTAGEVIVAEFEAGSTCYLIRSGQVQTVKCVNGATTSLGLLQPGEFFGEMAILENTRRSATCLATTDVVVLEFDKTNFDILVTGNPQIALQVLKLFCKRLYEQQRHFRVLCIADVSVRVADVFVMFDEKLPPQIKAGPVKNRNFSLTVRDVAHWAAIPVDVAKSELAKLSEKHRIEVFDDHIMVMNITDFRRTIESRMFQLRRS